MKLIAVAVVVAAIALAVFQPDWLLLTLAALAALLALAFVIVAVGRTVEWLTRVVRR